jgi:hypothetical protein
LPALTDSDAPRAIVFIVLVRYTDTAANHSCPGAKRWGRTMAVGSISCTPSFLLQTATTPGGPQEKACCTDNVLIPTGTLTKIVTSRLWAFDRGYNQKPFKLLSRNVWQCLWHRHLPLSFGDISRGVWQLAVRLAAPVSNPVLPHRIIAY